MPRKSRRPDSTPVGIGEAVDGYLTRAGLDDRLKQAGVIADWADLVGPGIAKVTEPESIAKDGTLFVRVATAAWAQELQMQTPMVLTKLRADGRKIRKIVWRAGR